MVVVTDPIGDLLVRLRNAAKVDHDRVVVPQSRLKAAILQIFKKEGVIEEVEEKIIHTKKWLEVTLKERDKAKVMPTFVRVSSPGRRIYVKAKDIPRPLKGMGLVVLSTPHGLMTGREASKKGVGGEILFWEK